MGSSGLSSLRSFFCDGYNIQFWCAGGECDIVSLTFQECLEKVWDGWLTGRMGVGVYGVELAIVFLLFGAEEGIPVLSTQCCADISRNDQSLICIENTIDRGMFAKNAASTCLVVPIGPELGPCFLNLSSTSVFLFSLHL
jgi:hypothetical protein